ncbi:MAG TPA: GNAT family N-acetyltransferase, partial [Hyphomicrobium sp.]|nr:GNAT family N-acetyltransferase [Hyphomicrobium sp.]
MIRTSRLVLRSLKASDSTRIATLAGVWDVASMTGRIPYPYSETDALLWVTGIAEGEIVFGIEHDGELIGICGYSRESHGVALLGYWIGQPYWGQGFATEAARALISYGFTKGAIKRFSARHFNENEASARVLRKIGFRSSGAGMGWCEARREEFAVLTYDMRRPWTTA